MQGEWALIGPMLGLDDNITDYDKEEVVSFLSLTYGIPEGEAKRELDRIEAKFLKNPTRIAKGKYNLAIIPTRK